MQNLASWKSLQHHVPCKTKFVRLKLQLAISRDLIVIYFSKGILQTAKTRVIFVFNEAYIGKNTKA